MARILIPILIPILAASQVADAEPRAEEPESDFSDDEVSPAVSRGGSYDLRSRADDQIVMPAGMYTLGGDLTFLTAPDSPFLEEGDRVRFTDIVLLGLGARYAIRGRAEVALGVSLLPKQPSFTDEFAIQSASVSARVGFARRYAGWARVAAGPTFGSDGMWTSGAFGVEGQKPIDRTIIFQGSLGANTVGLVPKAQDKMRDPAWFTEATVGGEIIFRMPRGEFAGWIGTSFHFPVAELSESAMLDIDPQTRANFHLGAVLSAIEDWDLSIQVTVVDRGDIADPSTTLPILAGGFDQTHISFGVTRRYKQENPRRPRLLQVGY